MTRNLKRLAPISVALAVMLWPALAHASAFDVVLDCTQDGDLDRKYSNGELRRAARELPADQDEYSDCREVITSAITSGSDRGGGRDDGRRRGSVTEAEQLARRADQGRLAQIGDQSRPAVKVGGDTVAPGSNGLFDLPTAAQALPLPLLLALLALGGLASAGALFALRQRLPT
jgi:hypothetical protein